MIAIQIQMMTGEEITIKKNQIKNKKPNKITNKTKIIMKMKIMKKIMKTKDLKMTQIPKKAQITILIVKKNKVIPIFIANPKKPNNLNLKKKKNKKNKVIHIAQNL